MLRTKAIAVVERLQQAGHEALFAGGCVRDRLLGLEPADYDIATSAVPAEVESLFERTVPVGRQFGIVLVESEGETFEVATFRVDAEYRDGRRPESVRFATAREDAERRDFTVNALFENPVSGEVHDYVNGRRDLAEAILRAVGEPRRRFVEDRLRLLRAVRFAARLGFSIEANTQAAIRAEAAAVTDVAAERIGEELARILTQGKVGRAFRLLDETGLLERVLPEIAAMRGCEQSPENHPEGDVLAHTLLCLDELPAGCTQTLALGVLLHDVAKPTTAKLREGRWTFYNHTSVGAEMAAAVCQRLRRSNAVTERVQFLVAQHLRHCSAPQMKPSTLKRFLAQPGIEELLELTRIDAIGSMAEPHAYEFCARALENLGTESLRPPALVNGRDLIELGLAPGPRFRELLLAVEDAQLEGTIGTREEALALVRKQAEDDLSPKT